MAKVKSHRGEPVNEYEDVTANKGRQASDDRAQWNEASGRLVFAVKKGNGVRHSTWRAGIKKAIKEKAGKWEVQRQLQEAIRKRTWHATGGASIRHERKLGFPRWWEATKQEQEIYTSKKFLDDTWGRTCFEWLQETIPNQKAGTTWCATFLLRADLSREELTKWLHNKLCERYQRDLNSDARQRIAIGTFGHIQSAGCLGTREAVIAAHTKCLNGLMEDICKHQVKRCAPRLVAEDKDKSLKSLWEDEEETLKMMEVRKKEWPAIRKRHVRRLLEAQDAVLLAYFSILWGFSKRRLSDS